MATPEQFCLSLKRWTKQLNNEIAPLFVRKIALDLLGRLTKKSPVDTGRFLANWMVGIGSPDETTTESTTNDAMERGAAVLTAYTSLQKVYISNNLPYATALEHGHSQKAPHGMVAVSIAEISAHLKGKSHGK